MIARSGDAHVSADGGAAAGPGGEATHAIVLIEDTTRAEASRAPDAPDRAAEHGGPARRGRRPRAEQPARDHRRVRGGPEGARPGPRARRSRRLQGFPGLPRTHRGRGLPLQGDHRQPPAVRARSGKSPRVCGRQRSDREGARAPEPPAAVRREPTRHRSRSRAAARPRQRRPAPAGLPRPRRQCARGDGRARDTHGHDAPAGRPRSGDHVRGRRPGHPGGCPAARLRSLLHDQAARTGDRPRPRHRAGHRGRPRRAHRGDLAAGRRRHLPRDPSRRRCPAPEAGP